MVNHLNSFLYMEMDGEFIETPYQTFEVISPTSIKDVSAIPKTTRISHKMASLKDAKATIEEGGCTIWGQLPNFTHKTDKFGLGLLQGLKGLLGALGMEDLLYTSAIGELMQLKTLKGFRHRQLDLPNNQRWTE